MLAALVPHPLPARGMMLYSCSASGHSVHRPGYRQVISTRYRPVVAGAGPWIQGPSSEFFDMDREMARMQQSFQQMERQMTREFQEVDRRASDLQRVQGGGFWKQDGPQTYRIEQQFEQRTGSGYFRGYRSESITYDGQPPGPLLHQQMQPGLQVAGAGWGVLALVFLLGSYLAVVSRLAAVWDRTRYSAAVAGKVIPLWPFLAAFSKDFRREIRAALFERGVRMDKDDGRMA